jgi:hypothetical protein
MNCSRVIGQGKESPTVEYHGFTQAGAVSQSVSALFITECVLFYHFLNCFIQYLYIDKNLACFSLSALAGSPNVLPFGERKSTRYAGEIRSLSKSITFLIL